MKPGHIKFFDGLRITTEHMNHLQGSFHSGFQDIRQILGIGKVYYGFEVQPGDEQSVIIQPGLAFDYHKNRIACDETITLKVEFGSDEDTKYVCVKYEQVEDGLIEGQATLVWDSCSALLREDVPEPEENLIPIAKLVRSEDEDGAFEIISLLSGEQDKESEEAASPDQQPEEAEENSENGEVLEEEEDSSEASTEPAGSAPNEEESAAEPTVEHAASLLRSSASEPEQWSLQVQQGVVRLAAEPGSQDYLSTAVIQSLTEKLISGSGSEQEELVFTLAGKEVTPGFLVSSLTCQIIISSVFSFPESEGGEERSSTGAEGSPSYKQLEFRSTAQGEATFNCDGVSQHAVSAIQTRANAVPTAIPLWSSDLTEQGVAHLPFSAVLKDPKTENAEDIRNILRYLQLLVRLDRTGDDQGFKITCNLLWKGEINEEIILKIQAQKVRFSWEMLLAWKALGGVNSQELESQEEEV